MRLKNVCELTSENFLKEPGWIKGQQSKTGRPYKVPIHPLLREVLDQLPAVPNPRAKLARLKAAGFDPLFPGVKRRSVSVNVRHKAKKLGYGEDGVGGLKISFHSSRHFYATTLAMAGFDESQIAVAL